MDDIQSLNKKFGSTIIDKNIDHGGNNTGGDMNDHGYSKYYERYLSSIRNENISLLEIGIFKGNGLAVWSKYFPNGKIYGLDIGVKTFKQNKSYFEKIDDTVFNNLEELYVADSRDDISVEKLDLPQFDIIIDDGHHKVDSQYKTFCNFYKYLNNKGIYIIEDISQKKISTLITMLEKHQNEYKQCVHHMGNKNEYILFINK